MNHLTNLVQFPGLGLSFRAEPCGPLPSAGSAFTGTACALRWVMCLALVFAFRHSIEFGVDPDSMVDVILDRRGAGHRQRPRLLCGYGTF